MDSARYSFGIAKGSPCLPDRVSEKLDSIMQGHTCFCDRPANGGKGGKRNAHKRHQQSHRRHQHPPATSGNQKTREPPSGERAIRAALNKLAGSNYVSISRRVIFIATRENVAFVVQNGLEKAYMEPEHSALYIRLFKDVLDSVDSAARDAALAVFLSELPSESALLAEVLLPNTDPVNRYDEFCATCKIRRRIVGRGATFCGLLQVAPIAEHVRATPSDVYFTYERVMRKLLDSSPEDNVGLDSCGAIEVMLESIAAVLSRNNASIASFRAAIRDHPVDSFPTAKCRFKVMDIIAIKKRV
jgi:hypothetical protein